MNRTALTLAEVMVAAVFLTVVLGGILMLFVNCSLLNEANRNLTAAITHAQYIMEEIKGEEFALVEEKIDNGDWDLGAEVISSSPYNFSPLLNEVIDTEAADSADGTLQVSVNVWWQDRRQRDRSIQIDTCLTEYQ